MMELTAQQLEALRYIKRYADLEGFPCTRRELAQHMGWSAASTAQDIVDRLDRKGLVERKRFGIVRLTPLGRSVLNSQVAA